jgi:hypothetical protein
MTASLDDGDRTQQIEIKEKGRWPERQRLFLLG